ncbi:MAG TPA: D-2-hydroxyacid dehydrogenase [Acidimicrobiales bacterium]|nr:D-2-hydroxyacid dehydrogenase [Acidimicrobiales bacterium]
MRILLTRPAYDRFWPEVAEVTDQAVIVEEDGGLSGGGGEQIALDSADVEVAWGTSDLYHRGAPLRPFFGLLRRAPTLRWFQSPAAGFDDRVFGELAGRGVRVTNAHVNGIPIAEFVIRSVLDHFQDARAWRRAQAEHRWETHDYREVYGTTWLVIGLGSIGGGVARRASAFGATVIGCRRHPGDGDPTHRTVAPPELRGVLGSADVVVLALPATAATTGLVDAGFLASMKERSVLVNVARGALVDEAALLAALEWGRPEAAVLDVFQREPLPPDHPFWDHPRVTVTAHNAAGGTGRYLRQAELFAANLARYRVGEDLVNDVTALILVEQS